MDCDSRQQAAAVQEPVVADNHGIRAKELYKYFRPNTIGVKRSSEPDSVLTSQAQLLAYRLNCDRALVSLTDRQTQYFVAEGVGGFDGSETYDETEWAACTSVPREGRLCEQTLQQQPKNPGDPAYFEILNLAEDPRYNHLPFIAGPPSFRYYCGVPITTKKGINIGSLFAVDVVPRKPIAPRMLQFMAGIAKNVMTHLELLRDKADKRRALNMNMCLAAFVDPEYASRKRKRGMSATKNSIIQSLAKESLASPTMPTYDDYTELIDPVSPRRMSVARMASDDVLESTHVNTKSQADQNVNVEDTEHVSTYKRAASLLYESMSLEGGGGVVFMLDTSRGTHASFSNQKPTPDPSQAPDIPDIPTSPDRRGSISSIIATPTQFLSNKERESYFSNYNEKPCEVLGGAHSPATLASAYPSYIPLPPSALGKMIQKYPRGKLFTLDADLYLASTPSSDGQTPGTANSHGRRDSMPQDQQREDMDQLAFHFPGARQITFVPLWDSISGRWAPCFIYNSSQFRTISRATDFLYSIAFCNCVATEISRLATLSADLQKQNFIGSISHELRSPLHGILGSMEFLNDTDCTAFQHSLIDTANSCAVTLLDTISMVLDYSKLNNFERNAARIDRDRKGRGEGKSNFPNPSLNIYGFVDLSVITEEVVEGVATGKEFRDISKYDTADLALPARSRSMRSNAPNSRFAIQRADVEIIIDIERRESWSFLTQPGAFRRIVMNLFGNALKYTQRGHIIVALDIVADDRDKGKPAEEATMVRLRVKDTGQGISPQFMRSKLFTPFSQENSLNPGTGLGLSLVKEIIAMLNGDISIQSEVGIGTEVTVKLPMAKTSPPGSSTTASTPTSVTSVPDRGKFDCIAALQTLCQDRLVAHFWTEHREEAAHHAQSAASLKQCLTQYFTEWYKFGAVVDWTSQLNPDVIVVDEIDLQALLSAQRNLSSADKHALIIVLCTNASRHATVKAFSTAGTLEFVSLPVGPYKLATALKLGLEKVHAITNGHSATSSHRNSIAVETIVEGVERATLAPSSAEQADVNIIQAGNTLAREDSMNAQMAMNTVETLSDSRHPHHSANAGAANGGFPFPSDVALAPVNSSTSGTTTTPASTDAATTPRPPIVSSPSTRPPVHRQLSARKTEPTSYENIAVSPMSTTAALTITPPSLRTQPTSPSEKIIPRLLLVDDNKINLRLLQTYMTKRAIPSSKVFLADDGSVAISTFERLFSADPPTPPQIIFMDLSMPTDGFTATRHIRHIEAQACARLAAGDRLTQQQQQPPALIIALTGLASERDQSEAFLCGFDLYMTKPVSFREVGRLLDNWTANGGGVGGGVGGGGGATGGATQSKKVQIGGGGGGGDVSGSVSVPHGALTGADAPVLSRGAP
ncbi:hypothetical protein EJ05DRAFT_466094 [Pseudovirgaria hyperparasitica]|uniref:Uncharacterized protein n=1 Tax=Pseudovirgaria hyperparasitica TaxID=470096 RepID=A0A6A6W5M0_9PEZI|nr:uncharacterized protein EJ05DRAFT_466094 [Pseudovirgaria hyperparasitica]KAF2756857.1 hypothetical protein EJ05DRAFT_466094 [Pseudovirgaria hyperparasitica]